MFVVYDLNSPYVAGGPCVLPHNALWSAERSKHYGYPSEVIGIDSHKGVFTANTLDRFADLAGDVDSNHIRDRIERLRLRNTVLPARSDHYEQNVDSEFEIL